MSGKGKPPMDEEGSKKKTMMRLKRKDTLGSPQLGMKTSTISSLRFCPLIGMTMTQLTQGFA